MGCCGTLNQMESWVMVLPNFLETCLLQSKNVNAMFIKRFKYPFLSGRSSCTNLEDPICMPTMLQSEDVTGGKIQVDHNTLGTAYRVLDYWDDIRLRGCAGLAGKCSVLSAAETAGMCVNSIHAHSIAWPKSFTCVWWTKGVQSCRGCPDAAPNAIWSTNSFPGSPA